MPLKIDLKPGEKLILNGAVLVVGKDGRSLILHNEATLLRDKDVMREEDADTPAKRIYFTIMLMYIDPAGRAKYEELFDQFLMELFETTGLPTLKKSLLMIAQDVASGALYRALKTCRAVIKAEAEILSIAQSDKSAPAG
jgi:flagellar protein FlbT